MALLGRSFTNPIIWKGDPNSAPVVSGGPVPTALVVSPVTIPSRGNVILASASADIYFGGVTIATPLPSLPVAPHPIVMMAPAAGTAPPVSGPLASITVQTPPASRPTLSVPIVQDAPTVFVDPSGPQSDSLVFTGMAPRSGPPVLTILKGDPLSAPVGLSGPVSVVIVRRHSRRPISYCTWITGSGAVAAVGPGGVAVPPPTDLVLDAYTVDVTIDAYTVDLVVNAQSSDVTLDAYFGDLIVDALQSNITLDTQLSDVVLDSNQTNLTLND